MLFLLFVCVCVFLFHMWVISHLLFLTFLLGITELHLSGCYFFHLLSVSLCLVVVLVFLSDDGISIGHATCTPSHWSKSCMDFIAKCHGHEGTDTVQPLLPVLSPEQLTVNSATAHVNTHMKA